LAAGVLAARFLGLIPALLGTLLIAICPFSIVMAGEYMMHGAVFGLLACGIACVVYSFDKRSVVAALLGGVLLCLAATMRQVTAVAVLFPWLVAVLVWQRKQIVSREGIAFLLGAVAVGSVFLLDCKQITGSYLSLPHSFLHGLQLSVQNLRVGVDNVESMIGWHLAPMLLSLPFVGVTLSLIGAGALVARRQFLFVLAAPFVLLAVAHFFVSVHGLHGYGARFLYEASPALLYLIAIFFEAVFCVSGLRGKVATVALFAVIVIENGRSVWAILPSYRDYNGLSNALATNLCSIPAAKAIVVMPAGGWQAADVASSCYDPTYSKRIFIEANEQSQWRSVVQSFSDWELYRVRGETVIREPMVPESKQ
jgi:4-amino-4-deoxy-L-arabinose transferase-like glycosyltransferase